MTRWNGWQHLISGIVLVGLCGPARGATTDDVAASIEKGRAFLLARANTLYPRGEMALATLALAKTGSTMEEPRFAALVDELAKVTSAGEYKAFANGGPDNYEAAVVLMALAAVDPKRYHSNIETVARYLIKKQKPDGAWDYQGGGTGDTSMTQYGILGLWEASSLGVAVDSQVWERALQWLMSRQDEGGGFVYHPVPPMGTGRIKQGPVLHTMSIAGVGTMIICRNRLKIRGDARWKDKPVESEEVPIEFDLLTLAEEEEEAGAAARKAGRKTSDTAKQLANQVNDAIDLGMRWVNDHFTIDKPTGPHGYYLYGVERLGTLAGLGRLGGVDWFDSGADYLISKQSREGSWMFSYSDFVDTSFSLLFLCRSTLKSMRYELVLLKEATAVGGRGLPTDDEASLAITRRNPRYQRALSTAVDEVLAALEKGEDTFDESAAAAVEIAKPEQLIERFGKNKRMLARLTRHTSAEVREAALWAAAKLKDYRLAPLLIAALSDPEPNVYRAADGGLRILSRKIGGVGLPKDPPGPAELKRGIDAWRQWYERLKVDVEAEVKFDDGL